MYVLHTKNTNSAQTRWLLNQAASCQIFAGLGILQRTLDRRLELVPINLVHVVDGLQRLCPRLQCLLVANDVSVVWACIGRVDIEVD